VPLNTVLGGMESLTNAEIYESFFMIQDLLDAQFQYWLSASIAVIVARFIGDQQLTRPMLYALAILYLVATALFMLKYYAVIGSVVSVASIASQRGIDLGAENMGPLITTVRATLFALGTMTTLWFLIRRGKSVDV